jgi:hypothetical protein
MKTIRVVFGILALTACAHAAVVVNPATSAVAYTNGPNGTKYIYNLDYSGNETLAGTMTAPQVVDLSLNNGQCVTVNGTGQLASAGFACGLGSGGVYPATATASFPLGFSASSATFASNTVTIFPAGSANAVSITGPLQLTNLNGLQCVQTNSSGQLVSAGALCNSGGGGGSSLAVIANGIIVSSPTSVINVDTVTLTVAFVAGSTATLKINQNGTVPFNSITATTSTITTMTSSSQTIQGQLTLNNNDQTNTGSFFHLNDNYAGAFDNIISFDTSGNRRSFIDGWNSATGNMTFGGAGGLVSLTLDNSTDQNGKFTNGVIATSVTANYANFNGPQITTVTFGFVMGSGTVNGTGAGQIGLTEGTSTSLTLIASGVDVLYADNGTHLLTEQANNTSTGTIIISTTPVTPGQCAGWTATGEVNSVSCGGGGGPTLAGNNIWTGQNSWTTPLPSSFTYALTASTMSLRTIGGFGGELDFWNSGNNNQQIQFLTDSGGSDGSIYSLHSGYMRIDADEGALRLQTSDTDRIYINGTGNIGVNENGPANANVGILGASANQYSLIIATSASSFQIAVSTNGHVISSGTVTSVSSCGTGTPSVIGNDHSGVITTGTGGPTACTLNFATSYGVGCTVTCTLADSLTTVTPDISAISPTAVTFSFSGAITSGSIYYICEGVGSACH